MGSDKGLLTYKTGTAWAIYLSNILASVCEDVFISVRTAQKKNYSSYFPESKLVTDVIENIGPAGGIISSSRQFPERNLFIVSCDMILLDEPVITEIYNKYLASPGFDFYGFEIKGKIQPFPGIFTGNLLKNLTENIENYNYSLVKFLQDRYNMCSDGSYSTRLTGFNSMDELEKCSGINLKKRMKD